MATIVSHNIISPLGLTSVENLEAILGGTTSIVTYPGLHNNLRPYSASLFGEQTYEGLKIDGYSKYESLVIQSIQRSLNSLDIDLSSTDVCLILSTTKGDIKSIPSESAERIANYLGVKTTPITVCNACISGVSAMLLAQRLIDAGFYKHIIVCGCDVQSEFVISGFQSLNAVSPAACRPFDIERVGLSLGEAVASVVISQSNEGSNVAWNIVKGSVRNDAYHNTTPSPSGEGSYNVLSSLGDICSEEIALINAHGTATMFNDQMESKAIERANLSHIPVNALKGYFGHTMGAAGIVETIISMIALDNGVILGTKGFSTKGVSGNINLVTQTTKTTKKSFIKMISGFGGCNGALLLSKISFRQKGVDNKIIYKNAHSVKVTPDGCWVDDQKINTEHKGKALLKEIYTIYIGNYPKFHKMDLLSQLGFVAIQLLHSFDNYRFGENCSIVLFNSSSSVIADKEYLKTISDKDNYFPSPALFVYTLPNIVLSEVAIKSQIKGETAFYILPNRDESVMKKILDSTLMNSSPQALISGWIDCYDETNFTTEISIMQNLKN